MLVWNQVSAYMCLVLPIAKGFVRVFLVARKGSVEALSEAMVARFASLDM